jgi:Sulfotransferase domain
MSLEVIGAGMPRTGTMSQKLALERLGFSPCHHMIEVFAHPWQWRLWDAVGDGKLGDWDEIFGGYRATTDAPGCFFWQELADRYPNAKLILSLRDPDRWYESMMATIMTPSHQQNMTASGVGPVIRKLSSRMFAAGGPPTAAPGEGRFPDKAHMLAGYEAHNAAVIAAIPPERLLVYRVSDGWEPLCRFLGKPVPDEAFPRVNSTEEFHALSVPVETEVSA